MEQAQEQEFEVDKVVAKRVRHGQVSVWKITIFDYTVEHKKKPRVRIYEKW